MRELGKLFCLTIGIIIISGCTNSTEDINRSVTENIEELTILTQELDTQNLSLEDYEKQIDGLADELDEIIVGLHPDGMPERAQKL